MPEKTSAINISYIFSLLGDRHSLNIIKSAYSGFRTPSFFANNPLAHDLSKKQYYVRLKRLCDVGLIEKPQSVNDVYKTTTFGSLIYNSTIKPVDRALIGYWQLKAIDVMNAQKEFPAEQKDKIINEIISNSDLKDIVNSTHLSSFNIVKDFDKLTAEILNLLENAKDEIYFATRYHQPYVSSKTFDKFNRDRVVLHIIDGNPENISVQNRINAILRTPPSRDTFEMITKMVKSSRFELLRLPNLPISFLVVDGKQVIYETVNYANPEQFTVAIANYDDHYLAQRFIDYFKLLAKDATRSRIFEMEDTKDRVN
jgi:hypothetical protein